jgi:hypothetical protein
MDLKFIVAMQNPQKAYEVLDTPLDTLKTRVLRDTAVA